MKMETAVAAPFAGTVVEVLASSNVQLDAGAPIVRLEPDGDGDEPADADLVTLDALATTTPPGDGDAAVDAVGELRHLVLR